MFGIEKDFQNLMEQVYGPLNKDKMTEIEKTEGEIKVLQAKLELLKEMEKHKTPVEEAYKDWMGVYPPTNPSVDNIFDIRWRAFQMGYNAAYEEKVAQEPEDNEWTIEKLQEKNWYVDAKTLLKSKEPEDNEWKTVALRFGEKLSSIGPCGYYDFTPVEWYDWVVDIYENTANEYLKLLEKERAKAKAQEPEEEPEELKTLYQMLDDKKHHPDTCVFICDIVKNWMSQYTHNVMTGEYLNGYEECLTVLEENLK